MISPRPAMSVRKRGGRKIKEKKYILLKRRGQFLSLDLETFIDNMIDAVKGRGPLEEFRENYIRPDVLVFDFGDINRISDKESAQRELLIILNERIRLEKMTMLITDYELHKDSIVMTQLRDLIGRIEL